MSKFNPSVLLFSALLYSIFISFSQVELFYFLPILFAIICEYKNIIQIFKKLIFLNFFIVVLFLFLLMQSSFDEAFNIYIRTNMIMLFNLTLLSNSNGYDIVRGLNDLKFPKRVVSSVYFTLKMIQTLNDEFKKIKTTLKARGFKASSSMFTYEVYGNLFGHIFVKSIRKANALNDSFKLRGFHGKIYLINSSKLTIFDLSLLFFVIILYVKEFLV